MISQRCSRRILRRTLGNRRLFAAFYFWALVVIANFLKELRGLFGSYGVRKSTIHALDGTDCIPFYSSPNSSVLLGLGLCRGWYHEVLFRALDWG